MQVKVRCFGSLSERLGERRVVELSRQGTVVDVLKVLGVDANQLSLVVVNGRQVRVSEPLGDGDEVMLVTPVSGGT